MNRIIAVVRAAKGHVLLAIYKNEERVLINPDIFLDRIHSEEKSTMDPVETLKVSYKGATQYLAAYQGIRDVMRYLMPFTQKGYQVNILTNQKVVAGQLNGSISINVPELQDAKNVINSLQNGSFSLQAVDPSRIKVGIA